MIDNIITIVPYLPLLLAILMIFINLEEQKVAIPAKKDPILDKRMNVNLTLSGLSFAIISVLASTFKNDLSKVSEVIYLFSLSFFFFICSYLILHFRMRVIYDTMSGALTDNGIWVIILGLTVLFKDEPELSKTTTLFYILSAVFILYFLTELILYFTTKRRMKNENNTMP